MISAQSELDRFLDRKGGYFAEACLNLAKGKQQGHTAWQAALQDMANLLQNTLQLADMHGRYRILKEADRVAATAKFSDIPENANPLGSLPFDEAIDDIITREPRLAESWQEVSRQYSEGHVFSMARAVDLKVTERVQKEVQALIENGKSSYEVERSILDIGTDAEMGAVRDWTKSYGSVVYRTNCASAYNGGRFEQAQDDDVREVVPAMEYAALKGDPNTRPWHAAAHGLVADTRDGIWATFRPPIGWQCRCAANFISVFELERRGLLEGGRVVRYLPPSFGQAHPDQGFRPGGFSF